MSHCVKLKRRSDGERAVGDGTLEILNPRSQRSEKVDAAHILPPPLPLRALADLYSMYIPFLLSLFKIPSASSG